MGKKQITTVWDSDNTFIRKVEVGNGYHMESKEVRTTHIEVDDTILSINEHLWEDTGDDFDTEYKWSVTTDSLHVEEVCETEDAMMVDVQDQARTLKAMSFLDYEMVDMQEDGVAIWDKPAHDR